MKPPKILGKLVYFFGYPVFWLLIKGTSRAYVVVIIGDRILLTQNWLGFQKKWRLAGGGIKHGEQPQQAATREMGEELGIQVSTDALQSLTPRPLTSRYNYQYYLYAYYPEAEPDIRIDNKEIIAIKFVHKSKLNQLYISEEARVAIESIGWL